MQAFIIKVHDFLSASMLWVRVIFYIILFFLIAVLAVFLKEKVSFLASGLRGLMGGKKSEDGPAEATTQMIDKKVITSIPDGAGDNTATSTKVINNIDSLLSELEAAKK